MASSISLGAEKLKVDVARVKIINKRESHICRRKYFGIGQGQQHQSKVVHLRSWDIHHLLLHHKKFSRVQ